MHRDPLVPTEPPAEVWTDLAADHWGPTPFNTHMLVIIDKLSRFPEVVEVRGTSAEANISAFDSVFSRHGFCKTLTTDNGPPFNGKEAHEFQKYLRWAGITHNPTMSAEDPEANGLAEAFMKIIKKIWHTSTITGRDAMAEINKRLQAYRATPHPTTGKAPAELMYGGRRYRTRLPERKQEPQQSEAVREARETDREKKVKQKHYKDRRRYVKPHNLSRGDLAQLAQKQTKRDPPYDPRPYRIIMVRGHQITVKRNGKEVTRDAKKWKKFKESNKEATEQQKSDSEDGQTSSDDDEILPEFYREIGQPGNPDESTGDQAAGSDTQNSGGEAQNGDDDDFNAPPSAAPDVPHPTTAGSRPTTRSQGLTLAWNPIMNDRNGPLTE